MGIDAFLAGVVSRCRRRGRRSCRDDLLTATLPLAGAAIRRWIAIEGRIAASFVVAHLLRVAPRSTAPRPEADHARREGFRW